jgi:large subunit ribosomal protein L23
MKERNAYQIIVKPLVTEKAVDQEEQNTYWFAVEKTANKTQIRQAVEEIYSVHVKKVRTLRQKGKPRRARGRMYMTSEWKKAGVTLAAGERIDII